MTKGSLYLMKQQNIWLITELDVMPAKRISVQVATLSHTILEKLVNKLMQKHVDFANKSSNNHLQVCSKHLKMYAVNPNALI